MSGFGAPDSELPAICAEAAQWTVRRDRGLSSAEAVEFELWLAGDPRHAVAMKEIAGAWTLLHRVPESVAQRELAAATRLRCRRRRWFAAGTMAAAAALAVAALGLRRGAEPASHRAPIPPALQAAGPRVVTLGDGTIVRLKAGAEVIEDFTATERRVLLRRGEAHFAVVKHLSQPFVVLAGAVRAQALGTAFNVSLQSRHVEVLVTEGRVRLARKDAPAAPMPVVAAGEKAVVDTSSPKRAGPAPAIVVSRAEPADMERALAWQNSLVRLGGATLAELGAEFERRFGQRIIIADPELASLRAGGRIPANDAEDFLNLLAATFDLEAAQAADGSRVLRKKTSNSR
jgi:transmembrane sensor